jgi:hypothetical protein
VNERHESGSTPLMDIIVLAGVKTHRSICRQQENWLKLTTVPRPAELTKVQVEIASGNEVEADSHRFCGESGDVHVVLQ